MKQIMDKEELGSLFAGLTNENREYILAIVRALLYAQELAGTLPKNQPGYIQPQENNR